MVKHGYREEVSRNVGIQSIDFSEDVLMACSVPLLIYIYSLIFCELGVTETFLSSSYLDRSFFANKTPECCHSLAINVQIPVLSPVNIRTYVINSPVQRF